MKLLHSVLTAKLLKVPVRTLGKEETRSEGCQLVKN